MQNLQYPLFLKFKITTLASDFTITDRNENSFLCSSENVLD